MINLEIVSTIAFFVLVGLLLIKDRKNFDFKYGIIIRRWQKGKRLIDKLVARNRKLIRKIGNFAIAVGLLCSVFGIYLLIQFSLSMQQAFGIVLPTAGGYIYPSPIVSIPFWYWIVAIFIVIASHETMHAIYSRLENIPIKSYGIILFLTFPIGAFVDPDENKIKRLSIWKKLRIFSVGSFGNLVCGLLILLIAVASANTNNYLISEKGIKFDLMPNTPAANTSLSGIIYKINEQNVTNRLDLLKILNETKPGENLTIETTTGVYQIKTVKHPESSVAYIGITNTTEVYEFKNVFSGIVPDWFVYSFVVWYRLLFWLFLLSLGVGIANLLPIKPLDGGLIFEEIFNHIFKGYGKIAINVTTIFVLSLLLFNAFGIGIIKSFLSLV